MVSPEKAQFFDNLEAQGLAITFDDVRLRTGRSSVSPQDVDTTSHFTRNIELKTPMASAAMDTVTEAKMAIAMAKLGGIGVIHAGLSIEDQADEVRKVKWNLNGRIDEPITIRETQSVLSVLNMCDRRGFDFRTFPVVNGDGKLVGLFTQNDFDFCEKLTSKIKTNMTPLVDVVHAPAGIEPEQAYTIMRDQKKKTLPLVTENGTVAGLYVLSDVLRVVRGNPENYSLDKRSRLIVAAAVPTDPEEALARVKAMEGYLDVAVIDTAQGDSDYSFATVEELLEAQQATTKILKEESGIDVMVGNVSEGASALALARTGADGVKIGQGGGAICSTRPETGIGCPQVTAVWESAKAIETEFDDVPVCADGGISNPGDISIALASRARSVMMGNMLSATKEAPGEVITLENGARVKLYRGMGSPSALRDNAASRKRYSVGEGAGIPLAEGVEAYVPFKGSVLEVMDHYIKALRKSMSYVGAPDIETHRDQTRMWRITQAGLRESHPHDISVITR